MTILDGVLFFLFLCLSLYAVFGGADFGAGIVELVGREKRPGLRRLIKNAIGPVWEANHIWLVVVIVILFNGLPRAFAVYTTYLHIPLVILLIGIVFRGCAFTFLHYDAGSGDISKSVYEKAFMLSSLLAPFAAGVTVGGIISSRLPAGINGPAIGAAAPTTQAEQVGPALDFTALFIDPWFHVSGFLAGIMAVSLCGVLACAFLLAENSEAVKNYENDINAPEADSDLNDVLWSWGIFFYALAILSGLFILSGLLEETTLFADRFWSNPACTSLFAAATVLFVLLYYDWWRGRLNRLRYYTAVQVGMIVLAWCLALYPDAALTTGPGSMALKAVAAPGQVLRILFYSLCGAVLLFGPALVYLFKVFKYSGRNFS